MSTPAEVFNDIYRRRVWGEGSGGGSDPVRAAPYCRLVEMIIAEEKIRAVLDIGCGDGRVLAGINGHGAAYYGLDCAKEACWVNVMFNQFGNVGLPDNLPAGRSHLRSSSSRPRAPQGSDAAPA